MDFFELAELIHQFKSGDIGISPIIRVLYQIGAADRYSYFVRRKGVLPPNQQMNFVYNIERDFDLHVY